MKALIHQKKNLFQVSLKNIKTSSIKLIKTKAKSKTFRFIEINIDEIKKFIEKLGPKKPSQKSDMSTNILKKMQFFFVKYIYDNINTLIRSSKFHIELNEVVMIKEWKK